VTAPRSLSRARRTPLFWNRPDRDSLLKILRMSYRDYRYVLGSVKDGRYVAPIWRLSCALPSLTGPGATSSDSVEPDGNGGRLLSVSLRTTSARPIRSLAGETGALWPGCSRRPRRAPASWRRTGGDLVRLLPGIEVLHRDSLADVQNGGPVRRIAHLRRFLLRGHAGRRGDVAQGGLHQRLSGVPSRRPRSRRRRSGWPVWLESRCGSGPRGGMAGPEGHGSPARDDFRVRRLTAAARVSSQA